MADMHRKISCFFLLFINCSAFTQDYPQNYFRNPLVIKMELVANYGEIRTNHWHMGLDIRTKQRENLPVYASAQGFVSRIVVEPGGFGQAIYIDHPSGFTTLYAHMNGFFPVQILLQAPIQIHQISVTTYREVMTCNSLLPVCPALIRFC